MERKFMYEDYLLHKDDERRKKYLAQAKTIKNKKKNQLTYELPESAIYWSVHLLWPEK